MDSGRVLFPTIIGVSTLRDAPQESQNFAVFRLSAPHWEQCIFHPATTGAALHGKSPRLVMIGAVDAVHLKRLFQAPFITLCGMGTTGAQEGEKRESPIWQQLLAGQLH